MGSGLIKQAIVYGGILLILTGTLLRTVPVQAETAEEKKIVRIGCFPYNGFMEEDESGRHIGYMAEYLDKITDYTGWEYELVHGDPEDMRDMLLDGTVDFIYEVYRKDEKENEVIFSSYPVAVVSIHLYTRADDDRYYYEDYEYFDGMRIGIAEGEEVESVLFHYAQQKDFTYTGIVYPDEAAMLEALHDGDVDAVVMGGLERNSQYKEVAQIGIQNIYASVSKEQEELIIEWDEAFGSIRANAPYYTAELYDKYYQTEENSGTPSFTREEAEYIQNSDTIPVALMNELEGLSYYEGEGEYSGIMSEVMKLIEERSGLTFEYIELEKGVRAVELVEQYGGNAIVPLMKADVIKTSDRLLTIRTNFESALIPVGQQNRELLQTEELRIVLPKSFYGLDEFLMDTFPYAQLSYLEDTRTCLEEIDKGEADLTFGDLIALKTILLDPKLEQLVSLSVYSYPEEMCMMVGQDADPRLISVLKKTADAIGYDELNQLTMRNVLFTKKQMSMSDFVYEYRYLLLLIMIVVIIFVAVSVILATYRRKNEVFLQKRNEQLREAMEQVESANMAKTTFLARVSHEIRTPMNAIVGIATLAENHLREPDLLQEDLGKIKRATGMLLELVNDILDMSAIEKDSMKIGTEPFYLRDVMDAIQSLYEPLCSQKEIDFQVERTGAMDALLYGDALRLNQVLNNLLNNAWKFTEKGGRIRVTVQTHQTSDKKMYADFSVEDTGCGIGSEMLSRLFKPFQQEDPNVAKRHGGSGLGLSICKNLVELMHGSIQVESEKGVGTTFRFSIPFACEPRDFIPPQKEEEQEDVMDGYDFKGVRVLLVEDNEINMEIAAEFLRMVNLEVDRAEDGQQALEMFLQAEPNTYALILTDIQMPNMGGHELTRQIRALQRKDAEKIPILAMTANAFQEDVALAMAAGMDGHVTKPIEPAVLYETIDQVLKKRKNKNRKEKHE